MKLTHLALFFFLFFDMHWFRCWGNGFDNNGIVYYRLGVNNYWVYRLNVWFIEELGQLRFNHWLKLIDENRALSTTEHQVQNESYGQDS